MKPIEWSKEKNDWLMRERGVSFEEVADKVAAADVITVIDHPNRTKYPNQQMYIVEIRGYVYQVRFVEDDTKVFLKTIVPNRKYTKRYYQHKENL